MFEKEAEEYKDNTRIKDKNTYIGFPDERISELQDFEGNYLDISERIIKTFKDGAEFGYNKANEWHFVKDGLPIITEKGRWLNLILKDRRVETFWWNFKSVPQRVIDNFRADVIAWKEIVLPKEIKENDI